MYVAALCGLESLHTWVYCGLDRCGGHIRVGLLWTLLMQPWKRLFRFVFASSGSKTLLLRLLPVENVLDEEGSASLGVQLLRVGVLRPGHGWGPRCTDGGARESASYPVESSFDRPIALMPLIEDNCEGCNWVADRIVAEESRVIYLTRPTHSFSRVIPPKPPNSDLINHRII